MAAAETPHPRVGVAALIQNQQGQIILGTRLGSHGAGTWAVPGGHLEFGESHFTCAEREVMEETGLLVRAKSVVAVTNDVFDGEKPGDKPKHYVTLFVECERVDASQEAVTMEPTKCKGWEWVSWNQVVEWAAHSQDAEYADRRLFLAMEHLAQEHADKIAEVLG